MWHKQFHELEEANAFSLFIGARLRLERIFFTAADFVLDWLERRPKVEKLPNAKIDGVCFWLDGVPVIGMSLQHDRIDNFWFVLRHECEHVLNEHGKKEPLVDFDLDAVAISISEEERIANTAAANFCAPSDKLELWLKRKQPYYYERDVLAFSKILERHPGIVISQIRRRLNRYDYLTRYLVKIRQFILPVSTADGWGGDRTCLFVRRITHG